MEKSRLFILIFLISGILNTAIAQQPQIAKYVIFTFEDNYKISPHGVRSYYLIVAQDSLKSKDNTLSKLFLQDLLSKNNIIDCCNGKDIDPFIADQHTVYEDNAIYAKDVNQLKQIVIKQRRKLQTITKIWNSGQKEMVTVFATAVLGKFCLSNFHKIGQLRTGYKGKVYVPFSSFSNSEDFWDSPSAKFILNEDFSKINFDIIPY